MACERLAVSVTPIFLRIALGITFLWAGMGKFMAQMPVRGEDAAILANAGVLKPQWNSPPARPSAAPATAPANPVVEDPPAPSQPIPPSSPPTTSPTSDPQTADEPAPAPQKEAPKFVPATRLGRPPRTVIASGPEFSIIRADYQPSGVIQPYTAKEFPEDMHVPRVHGVTLTLIKASTAYGAEGRKPLALVPAFAGRDSWPVTLAYAAAVAETLGGAFLLVGLFTRLSSLAIAFTIGMAAWLTELGPALQNGNTVYGVVPGYPRFDVGAWRTPLWQMTLFMGALALLFAGPGALSLDRLIFGRSKPAPKPAPQQRPM